MLSEGTLHPTSPCPTRTAKRSASRACAGRPSSSTSTRAPARPAIEAVVCDGVGAS
jgi:hypothetical protein